MSRNLRAMGLAHSNVSQTESAKTARLARQARIAQASSGGAEAAERLKKGGNFYNAQGTKVSVDPMNIPKGAVSKNRFLEADKAKKALAKQKSALSKTMGVAAAQREAVNRTQELVDQLSSFPYAS